MTDRRRESQPAREQPLAHPQDPFAYLEEGAIVPPRKPMAFRRTSTRRGFIAAGLAGLGATAWFGVPLNTSGAFYPGTKVSGLNIAELNRSQALALMHTHFADFENTAVDFTFEQQRWNASLAQLGFAIDYEATLDGAWQHGRTSGKIAQFRSVLIAPKEKNYPVIFTADNARLTAFLEGLNKEIVGAARDAVLYLDDDMVRIQPNVDGRALDIDAAAAATTRVVQSAQRGLVELTSEPVVSQITVDRLEPKRELAQTMINAPVRVDTGEDIWKVSQATLRAALILPDEGVLTDPTFDENKIGQSLADMATETHRDPVDATLGWDGGLVVVENDVQGQDLDIDATTKAIIEATKSAENRTIDAIFTQTLAEVNTENLDSYGIIDLVAEGDSNFAGSSWERAENVRVSAQHLTHTLVKPGETYSFLDAIGAITVENGFVQGKIIRGSWIVSDIGGGACQASTTVFRAALRAGFPIDHQYHTYRLAMYEQDGWPAGIDAAIYQPNPGTNDVAQDMTFVNTTENWLLVEFVIDDEMAYCNIYGTPQGWDVDIEVPYISDPHEPEGPKETEDDKLAKGERQQVAWAASGYDVQMVRTIRENGELVEFADQSNPWEYWSYFMPQRDEYLIGPGTPREFDDQGNPITPTPDSTDEPEG